MLTITSIFGALLLDWLFGEPRKFHPLVGFGKLANYLEKYLNSKQEQSVELKMIFGAVTVVMLIAPFVVVLTVLNHIISSASIWLHVILNTVVLYWAIGHQSLTEHALRVLKPCLAGDLSAARQQLAMIVSRDTQQLSQEQVMQATVETVLENGSDAIFAPLFWFFLLEATMGLGAIAVLIYRLSNTLDAMWGYRNQRFNYFGRFAARLDDVLNYIPARLVALSYALFGNTKLALQCWREQSPLLKSPNAGPVMTAGAGSLNVRLGGPTYYHQIYTEKPFFGSDIKVKTSDIERSLQFIRNTLLLWCFVMLTISIITLTLS